ncbi:MAG TPA: WYL domain-containing protein [Ktedonobacteraceae bacterium]|nr:WYL domain-containing protein [Ktedonobacteraceae bacterium]
MHIHSEAGLWYCEAYSYERKATRVYRVDRFLDVKAAPSPPNLEDAASPIVHVHSSFTEIRIHLTARGVLRLERETYLASRIQPQRDGEGLLSVRLRPEEYDWLVRILLSLGTDAKVLAPEGFPGPSEPTYQPDRLLVYLTTDDIDATLAAIEAHGGKTVVSKTEIPHVGWWAIFTDPAGNHIGLSIRRATDS